MIYVIYLIVLLAVVIAAFLVVSRPQVCTTDRLHPGRETNEAGVVVRRPCGLTWNDSEKGLWKPPCC